MKNKKPMIKETVGSLYVAFNTPTASGEFNPSTYEETIKSDVVKNIGTTENAENTTVRASGMDMASSSRNCVLIIMSNLLINVQEQPAQTPS